MTPEQLTRKQAKAAYKQTEKKESDQRIQWKKDHDEYKEKAKNFILTGIVDGEYEMDLLDPVYGSYTYVAVNSKGEGRVISSHLFGTVGQLILSLNKGDSNHPPMDVAKIYTCNQAKRNIF